MTTYIGLMSGTSMNGIDAVLVSFDNEKPTLLATHSCDIPRDLKADLTRLMQNENSDIRLLGETDTQFGNLLAETCLQLLKKTKWRADDITAIGSHGQTIYHEPNHTNPFTLQIGDPNIIAAKTNITTVADFRRRDVALNGQGAPLVPKFHDYLFRDRTRDQFILNIGGIANITYLSSDIKKPVIGFDTGPGNTLLDCWHEKHRQTPMDFKGQWARTGKVNEALLNACLNDPYFQASFPKSTGRDYFNLHWLQEKINDVAPEDVQATLTELTAKSIFLSVCADLSACGDPAGNAPHRAREYTALDGEAHSRHLLGRQCVDRQNTLWICGGGFYNDFLIERLRFYARDFDIKSTADAGIDPEWMEAVAFALLAKQTIEKKPGNCPSVTGAAKEAILGAVYAS